MQYTSVFPFTKLSGELQLLVLGECDPIAAGNLISLSPHLRGLYIRYPDRTIRAILSNVPAPVAALARVSLDLHNLADQDFHAMTTLAFLQQHSLFEWHEFQPNPSKLPGDPLKVLSTMIGFFLDVDEAAKAIGECWAAAMETVLDPYVQPEPAALSDTEYVRVACSLWVTQIFYQMRIKFAYHSRETANNFPRLFLKGLTPWQINQGLSIDLFLRGYCYEWSNSLHRIVTLPPTTLQRLSHSRYISRFLAMFEDENTTMSNYICRFRSAASSFPLLHTPEDPGHPSRAPLMAKQLGNHASPLETHSTFERHCIRASFSHMGSPFWDPPTAHSQDPRCSRITTTMQTKLLHKIGPQATHFPILDYELRYRLGCIERAKARQICEWTRCAERCTVEEWLHSRTNSHRFEQGKELLPWKYVALGAVCRSCGDDGHWEGRCDSDSWSEIGEDEFDCRGTDSPKSGTGFSVN